MKDGFQTVIELPEFISQAKKCLEDDQREAFINYIAQNPLSGTLCEVLGELEKYDGCLKSIREKAVELGLSIITMTKIYRFFYLPFIPKVKKIT